MALYYDQKEPCNIKINSRFTNPQVRKAEKLPAVPAQAESIPADSPQLLSLVEMAMSRSKKPEDDIDTESFSLGVGPLQHKKERLKKFLKKMENDEMGRTRFNKKVTEIKESMVVQKQESTCFKASVHHFHKDMEELETQFNPDYHDHTNHVHSHGHSDLEIHDHVEQAAAKQAAFI